MKLHPNHGDGRLARGTRSLLFLCAVALSLSAFAPGIAAAQQPAQAPAEAPTLAPPSTEPAPVEPQAPAAQDQPAEVQDQPAAADQPADPAPAGTGQAPVAPAATGPDGNASSVDRATLPHDLSPWGMFLAADIVVKAVMIGLAFASLVTWTVWLAKTIELAAAQRRARQSLRRIIEARSLAEAAQAFGKGSGPETVMVRAAAQEARLAEDALDHAGGDGLKERVASHLGRIEAQAGRRMTRGTGVLATIGSTAPFVGLFGTVWGIMNSFIGISQAQTTNLAVVAPGIAEALLATALGLVAAIPAVVIYNHFARGVTAYRQSLADASAAIERLVSRDLDYRKLPRRAPRQAAE